MTDESLQHYCNPMYPCSWHGHDHLAPKMDICRACAGTGECYECDGTGVVERVPENAERWTEEE